MITNISLIYSLYLIIFFIIPESSLAEIYKCKGSEDIISFQHTPCSDRNSNLNLPPHLSQIKKIHDLSEFDYNGIKIGMGMQSVDILLKKQKYSITRESATSVTYETNPKKYRSRISVNYTKVNSDSKDYAFAYLPDDEKKVRSYNFTTYTDEYVTIKEYENYLINTYGNVFKFYFNEKYIRNGKNLQRMTVSVIDKNIKIRVNFKMSVSETRGKLLINGSISQNNK